MPRPMPRCLQPPRPILKRMRPAHEVVPELVARTLRRRGRPRSPSPKQQVTLRLDADLIARLRASGAGWQVRVNEVLKRWLARRGA
jgi:uncharacterized protein (DUF4415 family)